MNAAPTDDLAAYLLEELAKITGKPRKKAAPEAQQPKAAPAPSPAPESAPAAHSASPEPAVDEWEAVVQEQAAPPPAEDAFAIITIIRDEFHPLGKVFSIDKNGEPQKNAAATVSLAFAEQRHVPDAEAMRALLLEVGDDPHAAISPTLYPEIPVGEQFIILSQTEMIAEFKLEANARPVGVFHSEKWGETKIVARLLENQAPSSWVLLDRDVDEHTPEQFRDDALPKAEWIKRMDAVLPGVSKVERVEAASTTARVQYPDGSRKIGGNGHMWVQVLDPSDISRIATLAAMARAVEAGLSWKKPRFSRIEPGKIVGHSDTTIFDPSVFNLGRLVFVGQPTVSKEFKLLPHEVTIVNPGAGALDTTKAKFDRKRTKAVYAKVGTEATCTTSKGGLMMEVRDLTLDTELELADGSIATVRDLLPELATTDKFRCQTPFRASSSMAAFLALRSGMPFVHDVGTGINHRLTRATEAALNFAGDPTDVRDAGTAEPAPETAEPAPKPVIGAHDKNFRDFVRRFNWQCCQVLGDGNWIDEASLYVAWSRCFAGANGPGGAVYFGLLQADGTLRYDGQKDFVEVVLPRTFKNLRNPEAMAKLEELIEAAKGNDRVQLVKWKRWEGYYDQFIDELKMFRKVTTTSMDVDMFSKRGSVEITQGHVRVRESFRLKTLPPIERAVIDTVAADFKLHFPQFDTFLDMILHARFAADRKEAFLWLHAISDWGKGFLMGVMNALGLGVELSVALINKAIAGETVPLQAAEIHRTWVVFVDEWKGASRELKQLNSEMTVAAKYANRVAVQLFAKVFMSAESVASMIEGGVESQFNNRFSYMSPAPVKLNDRPVFNQLGGGVYLSGVAHYAANRINEGVARMRVLGEVEAARISGAWLHANRLANSMEDYFGSLEEGVIEAANEIRAALLKVAALKLSSLNQDSRHFAGKHGLDYSVVQMAIRNLHINWVRDKDGVAHRVAHLRKPEHFIRAFLNQGSSDRSSAGKLAYKARDIGNLLSVAGDLKVPTDTRGRVRIYAGTDTIVPGNGEQVSGVIIGLVDDLPRATFDDV